MPPTTPTTYNNQNPSYKAPSQPKDPYEFIGRHRGLTVFLLIGASLLIGVAIVMLFTRKPAVEAEPESSPIPYFEHRYLLDYSIGQTLTDNLFVDLSNVFLNPDELASAPLENPTANTYTISLDEDSFTLLRNQPEYTYFTDISVSDGRTYTLYTNLDPNFGQEYLAIVLDRTDEPSATDHVFIYLNPALTDQEKLKLSTTLTNWSSQFLLNDPIIENLNLEVPEK